MQHLHRLGPSGQHPHPGMNDRDARRGRNFAPNLTSAPSPLESASRAEAARRLGAILDELDEDRRAVLILAELEEMSAPEIAEAVGAPLNTVYTRLRLARRDFDEAVARHAARDGWRLG